MSRCHYRCSSCETRHVFEHAPDTYKRAKKCRHCGSEKFRVDHWMNRRKTSMQGMGCMCAGYPVMTAKNAPHRRGSLYCWHRKDGSLRVPGDADFKDAELEAIEAQQREETSA